MTFIAIICLIIMAMVLYDCGKGSATRERGYKDALGLTCDTLKHTNHVMDSQAKLISALMQGRTPPGGGQPVWMGVDPAKPGTDRTTYHNVYATGGTVRAEPYSPGERVGETVVPFPCRGKDA